METLNNKNFDILKSPITILEFDIFFNGKLAHLPYIIKDRLQTILYEQFGKNTQHQLGQTRQNKGHIPKYYFRKYFKNTKSYSKFTK